MSPRRFQGSRAIRGITRLDGYRHDIYMFRTSCKRCHVQRFIWATLCVWEVLHAGKGHVYMYVYIYNIIYNVPYIRDLVVYGKFTLEMVHITNNYGDGCVPGCVH